MLRVVNWLRKQMITWKLRDQHVWDPRPLHHETEAETKTNYCETETETETKQWSQDHVGLETLTSLLYSHSVVSHDGNCVIFHLCSARIQFLLMDTCRLLWFIVCCGHMHLAKPNRSRFTMTVQLVSVVFCMQNSRRGGVAVDTADSEMHGAGSVKSLKPWTTGRL